MNNKNTELRPASNWKVGEIKPVKAFDGETVYYVKLSDRPLILEKIKADEK